MKNALLIILLTLSMVFAGNPPKSQVEVLARLVEIPGKMPGNDLYNYVYIFKFKVLKVIQGNLKAHEILVGVYNPRMARSQVKDKMDAWVEGNAQDFKAGATYKLKLVQPLDKVWQEAVEDEYFDEESLRWYALSVDLVP